MTKPIILRSEASALGLKRYFDGIPCRNGHCAERMVKSGYCVECRSNNRKKNESKEKKRKYQAIWRKNNPDKDRRLRSEWRAKNRKRWEESQRRFFMSHPNISRAYNHNRRARVKASGGIFTIADIDRIKILQKNRCAEPECRKFLEKFHIDHIIPITLGGTNWPRNLQLLCPTCNHRKYAIDPIEHARKMGRLI